MTLALLATLAEAQPCRVPDGLVDLPLALHATVIARQICGKLEVDAQSAVEEIAETAIQAAINLRGPGSAPHLRSQLSRFIQSQKDILADRLAQSPAGCQQDPLIRLDRAEFLANIETIRDTLHRATAPGGRWSQLQCGPD